ncbi:dihydrofolate reductase family protein [Phytomonospora sp. NPDC050363]|uniref:dihydrofolate reductase family protein n=1 Tax=Phytomonospora sp. NPDC050363 TaxID=3155642 RepID=UPI0033C370CC
MTFTASVFIGTSLDGYIARDDGDIEWLTARGEDVGDMGFFEFLDTVDTVILGRTTYETVLAFGEEAWVYGDRRVEVLSTTIPEGADPRVTVHRDLDAMIAALDERGAKHVYPDGGRLIQSLLRAGRVDRFIIATAPVLIGGGHRLFGDLTADVRLRHEWTKTPGAGFVQTSWAVDRP